MSDPYWRIFAEEAPSEIGLDLTKEQIDALETALVGAHENYGLASGRDVADANWRANENRRLEQRGEKRVLDFLRERVAVLNDGPTRLFDAASHKQKLALHEIFEAGNFIARERRK